MGRAVEKAYIDAHKADISLHPSVGLVLEFTEDDGKEMRVYYFVDHSRHFEHYKSDDLKVWSAKATSVVFLCGIFHIQFFIICITLRICARITVLVRTTWEVCLFTSLAKVNALTPLQSFLICHELHIMMLTGNTLDYFQTNALFFVVELRHACSDR